MAKDALDAILDGDLEPDDGEEDEPITKADLQALQDQLVAKDREIHGMLNELKSDRIKRQTAQKELSDLRGTVDNILTQRKTVLENTGTKDDVLRAAVEYTDDGDGYIELDKATKPMFDELNEKIDRLTNYIEQTDRTREADAQGDALIQSIVGEKPEYSAAYAKYKSAHRWLDNKVTAWQDANGVDQPLSGGQALDYVFTDETKISEFNEAFPGVNMADVLFAEDSQYQLRRMLENMANPETPELKRPDTRFQKVLKKPSGLGANANAKTEVSLVEKAGNLGAMDIMGLSDEAAAQLEAAMLREEKAEGIDFG